MMDRLGKVRVEMQRRGIDYLYSRNVSDIRWMTGFTEVFDSERAHLAFVSADESKIHSDSRYSDALRARAQGLAWEIDDSRVSHAKYFADCVAASEHSGAVKICIEPDLPLNEYKQLVGALNAANVDFELIEDQRPLETLRQIKDESEIILLKQTQEIAEKAFYDLLDWIEVGMTELEVANELEYRMRKYGAQGIAFPTIVASGENGANPHSVAGSKRLAAGELVVIDFGARYMDYCSDTTRTIAIGEVSEELHRIYDLTLQAHERCKEFIAVGVSCKDVHNLADKIISDGGYPGRFNHGLGHSVGIDVHENPSMNSRNDGALEAGNVVTVEPGIYIPGVGGVRIEDCGVVTENGYESFASIPRELITIG